ncbi:hypothetical protein [Embleya sp. MST-111070]|uniref:hypothetical protein n=1 Tax=Embleya sp. MST-111070 TaxID=3398231 RepID=UPI003F73D16B
MQYLLKPAWVEADESRTRNPYAPYLVAAGETFDVIEVDETLGRAALDVLRARRITPGPTILDRRYRRIGLLVPPAPPDALPPRDRRCGPRHHGRGCWITIPRPNAQPTDALVWLVAPLDHEQVSCTLPQVRSAIRTAAQSLGFRTGPANPSPPEPPS